MKLVYLFIKPYRYASLQFGFGSGRPKINVSDQIQILVTASFLPNIPIPQRRC